MRSLTGNEMASFNTFRLQPRCAGVCLVDDPSEMTDHLMTLGADELAHIQVAGELSNTILGEEIDTPLLLYRDGRVIDISGSKDAVTVRVAGSCKLDALVETMCEHDIHGVELLSGIPGTVGAAVVQNIGAYGQQIADVFLSARAFDLHSRSIVELHAGDFAFSYRSSSLKKSAAFTPRTVVLDVVLQFPRQAAGKPVTYKDILTVHAERGRALDDIRGVRDTVLEVRARKGLVVDGDNWCPCAGSFFMSPVVPKESALQLARLIRGHEFADNFLSWYAPEAGTTRFPAALIMRAGGFMNGDRWGQVGLSPHHILAICGYPGARGTDVVALSRLIRARIYERFDIVLEPEVRLLGRLENEDCAAFVERNPFVPGAGEPAWAVGMGVPRQSSP